MRRVLLAVALTATAAALTAGQASAGASPFDAASSLSGAQTGLSVLATPEFLPGEVDLTTLGVSPTELAYAGLAGATASPSAGAGPNMWIVDDDKVDCPNAQFTSIQAAVIAASPGDQIKVCPGDYYEQVRINKNNLTLFSEVPLAARIHAPLTMTYPNSIVTVVNATGVSIWQFTITGPYSFGACAGLFDRHTGVRIIDGSATIYGNHITLIRDVNPALFGCQDGIGVLVGRAFEAQTGIATLRNNLIDKYQKGGVVVDGPGSYGDLTQNEISGEGLTNLTAQNGVQVGRDASADVDHNEISKNQFVRVGSFETAAGILLFETSAHVSADHNEVFQNGVGIDVDEGAVGLTIAHNNVYDNIDDGIGGFQDSNNNLIAYNKAFDNTPFDCYDETAGPYPAGTANNWLHDMGFTQNRPGLCKQP
jgi:hypothetical protein